MDYQAMVENAMRGVVRDSLERVAEDGLPGDHHLYVTFLTRAPGVDIAPRLAAQYPEEMTIVLQYQFWGLTVDENAFEITLSFSGRNERLHVPFDAVTGFADPSVNFGLQFKVARTGALEGDAPAAGALAAADPPAGSADDATEDAAEGAAEGANGKSGEVVALDAFRKKKT